MKKIISILFAVLVINCLGMEAKTTEKFKKKNSKVSAKVNNDSINTQTAIADPTNFIVESKVVKIPAHNSFQPLLKHFPKTSRKIKSIKIYYITGLKGEIGYDLKDFMKASSLRQAKKIYSTDCITFDFDKNQQIERYDYFLGSDVFKYDNNGHLISIIDEEWGYRGSAAFKVNYKIAWKDNIPISVKRDIIEFVSEYDEPNDKNPPFKLDFFSDPIISNLLAMLKSRTTAIKIQQNTCRISGITKIENEIFFQG